LPNCSTFQGRRGSSGVPGVTVDDLRVEGVLGHQQRAGEGVEGAAEARVGVLPNLLPQRVAAHGDVTVVRVLGAEAAHLDSHQLRQGLAQVLDVDAGAAVDVRWVLVGKQGDLGDLRHSAPHDK
jgi:hypothetical protein